MVCVFQFVQNMRFGRQAGSIKSAEASGLRACRARSRSSDPQTILRIILRIVLFVVPARGVHCGLEMVICNPNARIQPFGPPWTHCWSHVAHLCSQPSHSCPSRSIFWCSRALRARFWSVPGWSREDFKGFRRKFFERFSRVAPTSIEQHAFLKNLRKHRQGR